MPLKLILLLFNISLVVGQFDYLLYPFENRVCQISPLNIDDFSGFRIQTQSITGYNYYHTRISFCELGNPDLDDAYFPVVESTSIPWATKICAIDIYTKRARENRPRCFIMARRKKYIQESWDEELIGDEKVGESLSVETNRQLGGKYKHKTKNDNYQYDDTSRFGKPPAISKIVSRNQYRPGIWIGGLFECPGLTDDDGIKCTDENALPILPLITDNPLSWWYQFPDSRHYMQRVPILYTYDYSDPFGGGFLGQSYQTRTGEFYRSPFVGVPPDNWADFVKPTENYTELGEDIVTKEKGGSSSLTELARPNIGKHQSSISSEEKNRRLTYNQTNSSSLLHRVNPKSGRGRYLIRKKPNNITTTSLTRSLTTLTTSTTSTTSLTTSINSSLSTLQTASSKKTASYSISQNHPLFDKGDGRARRPIYSLVNGRIII